MYGAGDVGSITVLSQDPRSEFLIWETTAQGPRRGQELGQIRMQRQAIKQWNAALPGNFISSFCVRNAAHSRLILSHVRIRSRKVPKVVAVEVSDSVQEPAAEAVRFRTADPPIGGGISFTVPPFLPLLITLCYGGSNH